MKKVLVLMTCLCMLVSMMTGITVGATKELLTFEYLTNNFETADSTSSWKFAIDNGTTSAATYTPGVGVDGSGAAKLTNVENGERFQTVSSVNWRKGGKYEIKVWMKASQATKIQICINSGTWMKYISSYRNDGKEDVYRYLSRNANITTEWAEYTFDVEILDLMTGNSAAEAVSSGEYTTSSSIFLATMADVPADFELYIDNFSVEEKISPNNIRNNIFANGIGDGTEGSPYQITTAEDFKAMHTFFTKGTTAGNTARTSGHFKLMNDIDMTGVTDFSGIGYFSDSRYAFMGTFDGNNHVIKNMSITESSNSRGFFFATCRATIKNLGFENANVVGTFKVGVLTAADGGSTITNCFVRNATLENEYSGSDGYMGAFVGSVVDMGNQGGLITDHTVFTNCYSTNITTIGYNNTTITNGGGFKGCTAWATDCYFTLNNCYTDYGQFATRGYGSAASTDDAKIGIGSLVVNNSYKSATPQTVTASKLSDAFIENDKATYNYAMPVLAWEADRQAAAKENEIFSNGMGTGTANKPYQLSNVADIEKLAELTAVVGTQGDPYRSASYKLMADIDMREAEDFKGLCLSDTNGKHCFTGTFDGNNHVIRNMNIVKDAADTTYAALIQETSGATIKNLGVEGSYVEGNIVAILVGADRGNTTLENCYLRNVATKNNYRWHDGYAGGMVARPYDRNNPKTTFINCYVTDLTMQTKNGESTYNEHSAKSGAFKGAIISTDLSNCHLINCYTDLPYLVANAQTTGEDNTEENCYRNATPETVTAAKLNSEEFIANNTDYNEGLPVLAWEADRLPEVEEPTTYTVSVTVGANGSVTKDGAAVPASFEVEEGASVTLTLVPDAKYVAKAKVNGADYTVTNNQVTLTVAENTTIAVTFERIPDVTPGFAGNDTSYTWFKTEGGVPTIFTYHKLAEFNTGETGLEYGVKLWNNANPEDKVILPARVSETETAKAVPGAMFAIKVYGEAIKADQSYTIVPYIGTVTGSEVAPDFE